MSIKLVVATERNQPSDRTPNRPILVLTLLAGLAGACIAPEAQADQSIQVTRQHIDNWNQTLQSGNIGDIMELYADSQPMLLLPDGKVATSPADIARFWRALLSKGDNKLRFGLIEAHKQGGMIIARLGLSYTGLQQNFDAAGQHDGMHIYSVIQQQPNGQWKTQIQKWN